MKKIQLGQTMIEVLVALVLVAIVMSAVTLVVVSAVNNAQFSKQQNLAEQYAQDGLEVLRHQRDSDYGTFKGESGTYCLPANDTFTAGACTGPNLPGGLVRTVTINQTGCTTAGNNVAQVTVKVAWIDGKCSTGSYCHNSTAVSCLSSFTVAPTIP